MKKRLTAIITVVILFVTMLSFGSYAEEMNNIYDAEQIFEMYTDCIFYIRVLRSDGTVKTTGSGYLISKDGYGITASHVINGENNITAELQDETSLGGLTVIYNDKASDIAIVKLKNKNDDYKFIPFSGSGPKTGSKVFAIGYPMKGAQIITEGIVNCPSYKLNGNLKMLISASLVSGMSGGPVINNKGEAIGLASGSIITMPGLYLSSPTGKIIENINKYVNGGKKDNE